MPELPCKSVRFLFWRTKKLRSERAKLNPVEQQSGAGISSETVMHVYSKQENRLSLQSLLCKHSKVILRTAAHLGGDSVQP